MGDIKTSNEMTPKEKAKELVYKFDDTMEFSTPQRFAKKCALIAVDEIIKTLVELSNGEYIFIHNVQYWEQVKNEINKL
jgi:uncharacterized protein (DUF2141 family)